MPTWLTRLLRRHVEAEAGPAPAEAKLPAAAAEFLRPSLNHYLPNDAAVDKAWALLERALTPEQRRDLFDRGYFYVRGKRFTYRIREGLAGNVDALDSRGRVIDRFCARPLGRVPVFDVMLAQKLWIETDENMFLSKAAPYPLYY